MFTVSKAGVMCVCVWLGAGGGRGRGGSSNGTSVVLMSAAGGNAL